MNRILDALDLDDLLGGEEEKNDVQHDAAPTRTRRGTRKKAVIWRDELEKVLMHERADSSRLSSSGRELAPNAWDKIAVKVSEADKLLRQRFEGEQCRAKYKRIMMEYKAVLYAQSISGGGGGRECVTFSKQVWDTILEKPPKKYFTYLAAFSCGKKFLHEDVCEALLPPRHPPTFAHATEIPHFGQNQFTIPRFAVTGENYEDVVRIMRSDETQVCDWVFGADDEADKYATYAEPNLVICGTLIRDQDGKMRRMIRSTLPKIIAWWKDEERFAKATGREAEI